MSMSEQTVLFDNQTQPVEAARIYELAIADPSVQRDTYLNLAVLYFVCNDGGFAAHHHLPVTFLEFAWDRAFTLLDQAEQCFGIHPEVTFWRQYFRFILLGEIMPDGAYEHIVKAGISLIPAFYLFAFTGTKGVQYYKQAKLLAAIVEPGATTKQRYIQSILNAAFLHQQ